MRIKVDLKFTVLFYVVSVCDITIFDISSVHQLNYANKFQTMLVLKNIIPSLLKGSLETSAHFTKRTLYLQAPLLSNPNKFKNGLNPWDEKIELEGTQKRMNWPAYNERIHLPDGTHRPAYVCHVRDRTT